MENRIEDIDRKINKVLSNWELPKGIDKNTAWQSVLNSIKTDNKRLIITKKWQYIAAACITVLAVSSAIFYTSIAKFETSNKEQLTVSLPDGSSVNLNSASTLSYSKILWHVNRTVALTGEGYFKVKKGSQFKVSTKQGTVSVLGTQFNVYARNKNFKVACYKGSVAIKNTNNSVVIVKGEKANNLTNNVLIKSSLDKSIIEPQWVKGVFTYSDALLVDVISEISRQYDVEIASTESIDLHKFTGEWNTKMPLKSVLEIVCLPFGLETNFKTPTQIIISSKSL